MSKIKTIFMGTPDFAVPCLKVLQEKTEIIAVVTQPDRPKGRGHNLQPSPVKVAAIEYSLPVLQPEKIKTEEFTAKLEKMQPDLIVVVAFGQILSQRILDIPRLGCVNVHASLLPRYRGAAPIHWSIINGEKETGVTTMLMDAGLDTGDMLLKDAVKITEEMTTEELHDRLMIMGARLLSDTVDALVEGNIKPEKQDGSISSYAGMLNKETCHVDWSKSAREIHNLVRGLNSWPVAWSLKDGKNFRLWRTRVLEGKTSESAGTVTELRKNSFCVATGDGILEVLEIQPPSKKRMSAGDLARGHGVAVGDVFC